MRTILLLVASWGLIMLTGLFDGKGPQAHKLKTKPRDFISGIYKFRSTPSGSLPQDDDIFRTISRGVRGTSMLAQLQLSESERRAVTQYP